MSVSCGEAHAVALCASGEVVTWGCGIHGEAAAEAVVYSVRPQLVPLLGVLREKEADQQRVGVRREGEG